MLPIVAHIQTPPPIYSPAPKTSNGLAKQLVDLPVRVEAYVCYGPTELYDNSQIIYLNHRQVQQLAEEELRLRVAKQTDRIRIAPTIAATLQEFSRIPIVNPNNSSTTFSQFQNDCASSLTQGQSGYAVFYNIQWTPGNGLTIPLTLLPNPQFLSNSRYLTNGACLTS